MADDEKVHRPRFFDRIHRNNRHRRHQYPVILIAFTALAAFLYALPFWVKFHEQFQSLSQAVADALVVAVVVSLAVEPRLLRYFGEELKSFGEQLGTQTFWSSFYSRAPRIYIDAIKALAEAEQFTIASNWVVSFDWVDAEKTVIKLSVEHANHRENRSSKDFAVVTRSFIYESPFGQYKSQLRSHAVLCEAIEFLAICLRMDALKWYGKEVAYCEFIPPRIRKFHSLKFPQELVSQC